MRNITGCDHGLESATLSNMKPTKCTWQKCIFSELNYDGINCLYLGIKCTAVYSGDASTVYEQHKHVHVNGVHPCGVAWMAW